MASTREEMRAKVRELEETKKKYVEYLLEQRRGIDEELAELGYSEGKRGRSKQPMSEETKQKIRDTRARRRATQVEKAKA